MALLAALLVALTVVLPCARYYTSGQSTRLSRTPTA
jgi:hypothetical protein